MLRNSRRKYLYFGLTICLTLFLYAAPLFAGNATLSWEPTTTNTDGTPLTDLAGHIIYYGTSSGNYFQSIDVGNVTTYQVSNLVEGLTYYFAVTAYDTSGNESEFSDEISKTIGSTDILNLVIGYYNDVLDRVPDQDGLEWWVNSLLNGTKTGADVAWEFVFSQEFINRNVINEEFLFILYRAFFGREPDTDGYNYWLAELNSGTSREDVMNEFIYSAEFANLCSSYEITCY